MQDSLTDHVDRRPDRHVAVGAHSPSIAPLPTPPDWFAVRTRARAEKNVRDALAGKGLEVFLPTLAKWSRWKDRKKLVDWPLFPGYVFCQFELASHAAVVICSRVIDVVSFAGSLAPIPVHEIESLRTLMASQLKFDPAPHLKEGALTEVLHGPLKGVVGRLVRKAGRARLFLSVDLIGQSASVEVDAADVRPY